MTQFLKLAFFLGLISFALAGSSKSNSSEDKKCEKLVDGWRTCSKVPIEEWEDCLREESKNMCNTILETNAEDLMKCVNENRTVFAPHAEIDMTYEHARAVLESYQAECRAAQQEEKEEAETNEWSEKKEEADEWSEKKEEADEW